MSLAIGRLIQNAASMGTTYLRDQRRGVGTHEAPITLARIDRMGRSGVIHVNPEEHVELLTNVFALRRYTSEVPGSGNVFNLSHGAVELRADPTLARGTHRWSAREADAGAGTHQQCSYCGAPSQRIGTRCEYCQVAVSR